MPKFQNIFKKTFIAFASFLLASPLTTNALILFEDDTFSTVYSDSIIIGQNDSGAVNTKITFGVDSTASENGNILWNISSNTFNIDHTTTITGGLSATGNVNFSGATEIHIREVPAIASASCTTAKELALDTTTNTLYVCTVPGNPGTWVTSYSSASDFETVYATDAGDNLVTSNGPFTINSGTNDFIVDSNDWNVTAAGALDAATITSNGLLTGSAGTNISGGILNFNVSSNFAANINTGTSTGQVSIGGGSNCVTVDSNTWDISCAGAISGLTGISSTGTINYTNANIFLIPQFASDPVTCSPGEQYYNTVTATVMLCTAANTWTSSGATGNQYVFAYDTTTQTVAAATTFQNVSYNTVAQIDGWTHPTSTNFVASTAGTYMVNVVARIAKSGGANTTLSLRGTLNGVEIPGSQSYGAVIGGTGDTLSGNFMVVVAAGDIFRIQLTGGTTRVQILPGGNGTTRPSTQLNIWRMK